MRIRFLQTTPSANAAFPFQAGQIIVVEKLTAEMRAWLKPSSLQGGMAHAEVLREADETATVGAGERATLPPPSRRA